LKELPLDKSAGGCDIRTACHPWSAVESFVWLWKKVTWLFLPPVCLSKSMGPGLLSMTEIGMEVSQPLEDSCGPTDETEPALISPER